MLRDRRTGSEEPESAEIRCAILACRGAIDALTLSQLVICGDRAAAFDLAMKENLRLETLWPPVCVLRARSSTQLGLVQENL